MNLSGGTLAVVGNVTFGDPSGYIGQGSLSRTGGVMTVSGNLIVDGNATVLLDDTTGSVATFVRRKPCSRRPRDAGDRYRNMATWTPAATAKRP